jgi:polysaccharide export outer membrane protein
MKPLTVAILGAVARPGTYTLDRSNGVADALASAGGLTEFAHKDRIFVLRRTPTPARIRFTLAALTDSIGPAALFRLRSGDVVVAEE